MIVPGKEIRSNLTLQPEVCVIGSGAGGAVMAARLAEAGLETVVLEEGGYWPLDSFSEREAEMLDRLYVEGANQVTRDLLINIVQGRMVGGSTVINMADNTRIPNAVVRHWSMHHHVEDLTIEGVQRHTHTVEAAIGTQRIAEDEVNANNAALRLGAQRLGWSGHLMNHNRTDCAGAGFCLLGCRYGAKRSADLTYIPKALEAGARIYSDVKAVRLIASKGRLTEVQAQVIDRNTRRPTGPTVTVRPQRVVLCAGGIHSAALLMKSKLCGGSGQLGKNLSLQPQSPVMAQFDQEIAGWRGLPQSYVIDQFTDDTPEKGMGGFRLEGIFGGPGQVSGFASGLGEEHLSWMKNYDRFAAAFALCPDQPSGEIKIKGEKHWAHYKMTDELMARMKRGQLRAAEAFFAAGAQRVSVPYEKRTVLNSMKDAEIVQSRKIEGGRILLVSAHPQGTCRMGQDPKKAVVDSWGRSHEIANLWIADASTHPTTASSHTMVPIMALAERTAEKFLETES